MKKVLLVINPVSGKLKAKVELFDVLHTMTAHAVIPTVMMTRRRGEAKDIAASCARSGKFDAIFCCGGDGTLNRLINEIGKEDLDHEILYFPTGSGNDFIHDLGMPANTPPFLLNPYVEKLPRVRISSKEYKFINGAGAGFDGYCCAAGNNKRSSSAELSKKPINYTAIAVKGLLFAFKPTSATITVDGVVHEYKRVWMCPIMKGRFFGGGMMIAPNQDRLDPEGTLTVVVAHKLRPLRKYLPPGRYKNCGQSHNRQIPLHRLRRLRGRLPPSCDFPAARQPEGCCGRGSSHEEEGSLGASGRGRRDPRYRPPPD